MDAGATLYVPEPGASCDSHLWTIISDPKVDPEHVLIVNLTTWEPLKDQACILEVGDHPYIQHRTCVNYGEAKVVTLAALYQLKDAGMLQLREPLSPVLLHRIRQSAARSTRMLIARYELLERQGLVKEE